MKTYGYTSSDLSLLNDRIEFTDNEIGNGCKTVLNETVTDCIEMIESLGWRELSFSTSSEFIPDFIDSNCEPRTRIIRYLILNMGKSEELEKSADLKNNAADLFNKCCRTV